MRELIEEIRARDPGMDPPSIKLQREGFEIGLKTHPDIDYAVKFIEKMFQTGWKITENDIRTSGNPNNYKLTRKYIKEALLQIRTHLDKGSIWGPFEENKLPEELQGGAVWPVFFRDESNEKG